IDRGGKGGGHASFAQSTLVRFDRLPAAIDQFRRQGVTGAIVFGVSAGDGAIPLHAAGLRTVAVITEMPLETAARSEEDLATTVMRLADVLVARSESVP